MKNLREHKAQKRLTVFVAAVIVLAIGVWPTLPGEPVQELKAGKERLPSWFIGKVVLCSSPEKGRGQYRRYPVLLYVKGTEPHWQENTWFFWGYFWYQEADVIMDVDGVIHTKSEPGPNGRNQREYRLTFVEELLYAAYDIRGQGVPESLLPYPGHGSMVYRIGFGLDFSARRVIEKETRCAPDLQLEPVSPED